MRIKPLYFFLFILLLNLLQSGLTPIARDEAYYWMFGQHLDWGYFDHPPMVALMTYLGNLLFENELGVRLITCLMSSFTAYFVWMLLSKESRSQQRSLLVFALIYLANPLFNLYGFITTTDVPLLFFTASYLLVFKRFLERQDLINSLLLGLVMSLLIYSKYHGILIIFISVFSRIRLFLKPWIWLAGIFGAMLYIPHLWWQYQHDFVSFNYHLFYRSTKFEWSNIFEYLLNVFLVMNPLIFWIFVREIIKSKGMVVNRDLSAIFWGIFGFFLLTSARGHVEPHWVAMACIPYTVYLTEKVLNGSISFNLLKPLALTSLILIFTLRIAAVLPLPIKSEFHSEKKDFYDSVKSSANGRKVVIANSYTHAAKYSFYTGQPTFSYNFISFRRNQYDMLDLPQEFNDRDATVFLMWPLERFNEKIVSEREAFYYKEYDSLQVLNNIRIDLLDYPTQAISGSKNELTMRITNPYPFEVNFRRISSPVLWELYFFYPDKERHGGVALENVSVKKMAANSELIVKCSFQANVPPGPYTLGAAIRPLSLFPISVSKRTYPIEILADKDHKP